MIIQLYNKRIEWKQPKNFLHIGKFARRIYKDKASKIKWKKWESNENNNIRSQKENNKNRRLIEGGGNKQRMEAKIII